MVDSQGGHGLATPAEQSRGCTPAPSSRPRFPVEAWFVRHFGQLLAAEIDLFVTDDGRGSEAGALNVPVGCSSQVLGTNAFRGGNAGLSIQEGGHGHEAVEGMCGFGSVKNEVCSLLVES